jgi:hypothetical protein
LGKFIEAFRKVRDAYKESGLQQAFKACRADFWCRVCMETTLPLVFGVGWAAFALLTSQGWYAAISGLGIAFMFVMSLQAQPLRIEKNVQDAQDSDEFRTSFASIQEGLSELRASQARQHELLRWEDDAAAHEDRLVEPGGVEGFKEAYNAVERGLHLAGAITAAVEFERLARQMASMRNVNPRGPLTRVIGDLLRKTQHTGFTEELRALVKLRNGLVHSELEQRPANGDSALQLVQAFENGIHHLHIAMRPGRLKAWG